MKRIRGALLDIDGTFLDSNDAHARAWVVALSEVGIEASFEHMRRLIGKGGDKVLPEVAKMDADSPEGKKLTKWRSAFFLERLLPKLAPFPGARDLIVRLKSEGVKLVIATSAKEEELAPLLRQAGISDLIEAKVTSSDAKSSKPDPDIVEAAIARAELPKSELLMVGDTPYDIEAARKAGVASVAFRCGGWGDEDLRDAVGIYDGPADLLAQYDSSPFGER